MKKRKKLTLHRETLKEMHQREILAGTGEQTGGPISYPTEVYSSCPPCD